MSPRGWNNGKCSLTPAQASELILDIHIQGKRGRLGGSGRKSHHGKGNQLSLLPQKTSERAVSLSSVGLQADAFIRASTGQVSGVCA